MSLWRVYSGVRAVRVGLEGAFAGATAFLVGGSPRLLELDLRLLNIHGCWSMAINNAAVVFEPQAFICLDTVDCFNRNIFTNLRIQKFINYARYNELVEGKALCKYPNTFFFDMIKEDDVLMTEFCKLDGPIPFLRSTFLAAIALLYQLGFMRVYLIGCTFDVSKGAYAHEYDIGDDDKASNQIVYDSTVDHLRILVPRLAEEGMEIITCHEMTSLDGVCAYRSFNDAVSSCAIESSSGGFDKIRHVKKVLRRD